jgi:hypothetical protein
LINPLEVRGMKALLLTVALVAVMSLSVAQTRPANDVELALIRFALEVDEIPEWRQLLLLDVGGTVTSGTQSSSDSILGWAWFHPYLVHDKRCLAQRMIRTASRTDSDSDYEWHGIRHDYRYWKAASAADCELSESSQIPSDAVTARVLLPSAQLVDIVDRADELLRTAFEHVLDQGNWGPELEREPDVLVHWKEGFEQYRRDPTLRLSEIALTTEPSPGHGVAYVATYRGTMSAQGPVVTFSVTGGAFVVHSVGYWIA